MIRAKINGIEGEFPDRISVLAATRLVGVEIPTLCNDARLDPVGACRMCLVDIKGHGHEAVSCTTALTSGMEVETHSTTVEDARKWNLRMLAGSYPVDAFTAFPDKPFHSLARAYGLTDTDFKGDQSALPDESHTYINVDMSRCINC